MGHHSVAYPLSSSENFAFFFHLTTICCNSSTQTLGLGRKEKIKMCSSSVLMFLEEAVPI